jgi:hypothetical protein
MNRVARHFGALSSLPSSGGLLLVLRLLPPGGN